MSVLLRFEKLNNIRDLGGMPAAGGKKIRPGLLYRSGFLQKASKADIRHLEALDLAVIVDFRSENETREQADPPIGHARQVHLPAEDAQALGIERDEESKKRVGEILIERVIRDPSYAQNYMSGLYRRFVSNPYTVGQYRRFLDLVRTTDGPILWHCTAGKDRAGFASILLEEILGVDRAQICRDYLETNKHIREEVEFLVGMFERMYNGTNYPKKDVRLFFSAEEAYFDALYREAEEKYGSFENYLRDALGVTEEEKQLFREKYLEDEKER